MVLNIFTILGELTAMCFEFLNLGMQINFSLFKSYFFNLMEFFFMYCNSFIFLISMMVKYKLSSLNLCF